MEKVLVLTAGLSGAGKSTVIKTTEYKNLPVVDADLEKIGMVGYDPKNITLEIHNASKVLARQKQLFHLSQGNSFIVDGTGTNVEKYIQFINEAKELGYKIVLLYVKVSTQTAIKRNSERARTVPVEVILQKSSLINQSVDMIATLSDQFITINND